MTLGTFRWLLSAQDALDVLTFGGAVLVMLVNSLGFAWACSVAFSEEGLRTRFLVRRTVRWEEIREVRVDAYSNVMIKDGTGRVVPVLGLCFDFAHVSSILRMRRPDLVGPPSSSGAGVAK
jgi:hypothetical protein